MKETPAIFRAMLIWSVSTNQLTNRPELDQHSRVFDLFESHSTWNSHMCCTLTVMVSLWCASTWWRVQKDTTWQTTLKKFSCVGVCLCVSCYITPQHVRTLLWNVLIPYSVLSLAHTLSHSLSLLLSFTLFALLPYSKTEAIIHVSV